VWIGTRDIPFATTWNVLWHNDGSSAAVIIHSYRIPRTLLGFFVGAALGLSGALMQALTRNPLADPGLLGISLGASSGVVVAIAFLGIATVLGYVWFAFAGAAVASVLAMGEQIGKALGANLGRTRGIGALSVTLLCGAATAAVGPIGFVGLAVPHVARLLVGPDQRWVLPYSLVLAPILLLTRASLQDALAGQAWLIGSVNGRGWDHAPVVGIALAVLMPLALYRSRRLAMLELGDDVTRALGVGVQSSRLILIVVSVALAAITTAAAGPIAFVALAAPQLARKLTKTAGVSLVPAALLGALLLTGGDLAVQRLFPSSQLPVGTATGTIGGLYLIWLLAREWRRGRQ
jgi:iron complex transport system permease protein